MPEKPLPEFENLLIVRPRMVLLPLEKLNPSVSAGVRLPSISICITLSKPPGTATVLGLEPG